MDHPSGTTELERSYISTGHLPEPEMVQKLVSDSDSRFRPNRDGENSQVYPALARVPRDLFGVCVVSSTGRVYGAGEIQARLRALKIGLLIMAGLSLLAVIPAGRLPHYLPGELPGDGAEAREARSR
jgi:hypothetical protein